MNTLRKKCLQDITIQFEALKGSLKELQMLESLQNPEKQEKSDDTISKIENAVSNLEDIIGSIKADME